MRFLTDENFPLGSIKFLRKSGHDVAAVIEDSPGAKDHEVLTRASREQRVILTFDRDYGELIYRRNHSITAGIIYLRFIPETPLEPADFIIKLMQIPDLYLEGRFTIVERTRIRQRPLLLSIPPKN